MSRSAANICFMTEAGNSTGMGHLSECLALAEEAKKIISGKTLFITNNYASGGRDDIRNIAGILKKRDIRVLVADLFDGGKIFEKLRRISEKLVVILDDDIHRDTPADITVNFNIAQDNDFYRDFRKKGKIYCIGPKYAPQGNILKWALGKSHNIKSKCGTIFVNQGGSDPFALTLKIIKSLELLSLSQKIVVVVGPAVSKKHKAGIKKIIPRLKNKYRFEWGVSQERMYEIMKDSDIAITAAGNTLYELAVFGIPSIVICHHARHNKVAKIFAKRGAVINMGVGAGLSEKTIARKVEALLKSKEKQAELSRNIRKISDGLGAKRIVERIAGLCKKS